MKNLIEYTQREFDVNETLKLLKSSGSVYFSWGVSKLINYDNKGLLIRVNGHHHDGWVFIVLAWNDTYTVHYLNQRYNLKKTADQIYFDMLVDEIDETVERIDDYKF